MAWTLAGDRPGEVAESAPPAAEATSRCVGIAIVGRERLSVEQPSTSAKSSSAEPAAAWGPTSGSGAAGAATGSQASPRCPAQEGREAAIFGAHHLPCRRRRSQSAGAAAGAQHTEVSASSP